MSKKQKKSKLMGNINEVRVQISDSRRDDAGLHRPRSSLHRRCCEACMRVREKDNAAIRSLSFCLLCVTRKRWRRRGSSMYQRQCIYIYIGVPMYVWRRISTKRFFFFLLTWHRKQPVINYSWPPRRRRRRRRMCRWSVHTYLGIFFKFFSLSYSTRTSYTHHQRTVAANCSVESARII